VKPYYQEVGITIWHADCRDVLPTLAPVDVVITDPVWPNAIGELAGSDDPLGLFTTAAAYFPALSDRLVVQLGCDSDPRFLTAVPAVLPFFRACWLEYACPHYKGRLLYTGDVAYVYGTPPPSRPGAHVMPGRSIASKVESRASRAHPAPRKSEHVRWLVNWFARGVVLDPFMGSGTTLEAAKACGYGAIGIEVDERWCELAAKRLQQNVFSFDEVSA
jgi:site-specific DNA-methyltransferase (adenine-specific)